MARLLEDIQAQSDWIVQAFGADKLVLDYSVESFKRVDEFFDKHVIKGRPRRNGRLSQNLGPILFAIGSYVGETIIKNAPGTVWRTNDEDPEGEVNAELVLSDGTVLWPMQKVVKRFRNGAEDGIYAYGAVVVREIAPGDYWNKLKEKGEAETKGVIKTKKPWWKFW